MDKYISKLKGDLRVRNLEGRFKDVLNTKLDLSHLEDLADKHQQTSFAALASDEENVDPSDEPSAPESSSLD